MTVYQNADCQPQPDRDFLGNACISVNIVNPVNKVRQLYLRQRIHRGIGQNAGAVFLWRYDAKVCAC